MNETTKTVLIVGGLAIVGFIAYKKFTGPTLARTTSGAPAQSGQTGNATTGGNWWDSLGNYGTAISGAIGTADHTYNSVYNWFTSGSSSQQPAT